jgi:predicted O-methyltransferase YrrM
MRPLVPPLQPTPERWRELKLGLDPRYEQYVTDVSNRTWAASLEISSLLLHLCEVLQPSSVLELGSGFTSYVLRRYKQEADHAVSVVSLDHSPEWLEKTSAFLESVGCEHEGLRELAPLRDSDGFDLVFNDLFGEIRDEATKTVLPHLLPGGAILVDDTSRANHRRALVKAGSRAGLRFYDVRRWTNDVEGRWGMLGIAPA